jgi:hypothetical protein
MILSSDIRIHRLNILTPIDQICYCLNIYKNNIILNIYFELNYIFINNLNFFYPQNQSGHVKSILII